MIKEKDGANLRKFKHINEPEWSHKRLKHLAFKYLEILLINCSLKNKKNISIILNDN